MTQRTCPLFWVEFSLWPHIYSVIFLNMWMYFVHKAYWIVWFKKWIRHGLFIWETCKFVNRINNIPKWLWGIMGMINAIYMMKISFYKIIKPSTSIEVFGLYSVHIHHLSSSSEQWKFTYDWKLRERFMESCRPNTCTQSEKIKNLLKEH